jgi:hypothetical protein
VRTADPATLNAGALSGIEALLLRLSEAITADFFTISDRSGPVHESVA